jgi:hypothetical protein
MPFDYTDRNTHTEWREPPEFKRASQDCDECFICGKTYGQHKWKQYCNPQFPLHLFQTCDGKFWKL